MSAYIVACTRIASGRSKGALRNVHPVTLGSTVINELLSRVPHMDPAHVDDVIFGCVSQVSENAGNMAR